MALNQIIAMLRGEMSQRSLNVKWYGAKGDDSNDDTVAIQNAANAAAGTVPILFPPGTYKVTGAISLNYRQVIEGNGATIDATGLNTVLFTVGDGSLYGYANPIIRGLTITGSAANTGAIAVKIVRSAMPVIEKCTFNSINCIQLEGESMGARIDHCYGYGFPGFAVKTSITTPATWGPNGTEVNNCIFESGNNVGAIGIISGGGTIKLHAVWLEAIETLIDVNSATSEGMVTATACVLVPSVKPGANTPLVVNLENGQTQPINVSLVNCRISANQPYTLIKQTNTKGFNVENCQIFVGGTGAETPLFDLQSACNGLVNDNVITIGVAGNDESIIKCTVGDLSNLTFTNNRVTGNKANGSINNFVDNNSDHTIAYSLIAGNTFQKIGRFRTLSSYTQLTNNIFACYGASIEVNANTVNVIMAGNIWDTAPNYSSTGIKIKRYANIGYVTENSGTATVASGTATIAVNHGLSFTPTIDQITVTPSNSMGSATKFWVTGVTATQFVINVDVDPGAATAIFAWTARTI